MSMLMRSKALLSAVLLGITLNFSPLLLAETVEQTIRLELVNPGDSASCQVKAVFKGDHDNCKNDNAGGRADCSKDTGCVCTRQEKHITWVMAGKTPFTVAFDQGGDNPFVTNGESACNFKGNKDGKLRCRVKGKNVPRGIYRYSITSQQCAAAKAEIKVY
jgi:hypothetical protein